MKSSEKLTEEIKKLYKKKEGKEMSDSEAQEATNNLIGLADLLFDIAIRDQRKKKRLKTEPKGFPVDGQYSCIICGCGIDEVNGWYDWNGNKCSLCQKALDTGVVPSFICHNSDSYIKTWQLKSDLGLHIQTVKKYVREGKLVAREILNEDGKVHEYIFLKKENPNLIIKFNPIRKSYDRHRDKKHRKWVREEMKNMKLNKKIKS